MDVIQEIQHFLAISIANNLVSTWIVAFLAIFLLYQSLKILKYFFIRQLHKKQLTEDSWGLKRFLNASTAATANWFLLGLSIYAGCQFLNLPSKQTHFIDTIPVICLFIQLSIWVKTAVEFKLGQIIASKRTLIERQQFSTVATPVKFVILFTIWSLILLATLDNLGVNITALVAGLGIGGVAVALAVQSTLGDLLAALTIAFDKPFIVGDFIVTGNLMGTIEKIGLKTTRVRSLGGEELIFPNQDLLSSRIQNYKRMQERRVVFSFGVLYQTPVEKLREIPTIVKDIIQSLEKCRLDRAHFFKFGDSSFDFEVVYYILSPEYNEYMDCQQIINLNLVERFEAESIEFAYPTRTLYVAANEYQTLERTFSHS